jgi:hypothetical protein
MQIWYCLAAAAVAACLSKCWAETIFKEVRALCLREEELEDYLDAAMLLLVQAVQEIG